MSNFSQARSLAAMCVCSLVAPRLHKETGEKSDLRSPFEANCHGGPLSSVSHCGVFVRSLSLKSPHTDSLFH